MASGEKDRSGKVFVGEDMGPEAYLLTGLFSAHWEAEDGIDYEQGPTSVSLADALEWARGRADVVYLRLADSDVHHAAGARNPYDDPVWPEGTEVPRPREAGMEHLDLVADEPILWRASLPRPIRTLRAGAEAQRVRARLAGMAEVVRPSVSIERSWTRTDLSIAFEVRARTHEEAMHTAFEIEGRATEDLIYPRRVRRRGHSDFVFYSGSDPYDTIRPAS